MSDEDVIADAPAEETAVELPPVVEVLPPPPAHLEPAARKHFWQHPASEHDPYPDKAATMTVVKDGVRKRIPVHDEPDALKAGWVPMPPDVA